MFDLPAYFARIDMPARPTLDSEGLSRLQRAHRLAIPFENLDIRLGRGIVIDSASVFAKIVVARRGGYCFEHNRLFLDALEALGFAARPLLARVWLNAATTVPPLTHALSLVTIAGEEWIADAGFGGAYSPVMPLVDGAEATAPDGGRFLLRRDEEHGWMLSRDGGDDGGARQYSFDTRTVHASDLEQGNWWASTAPDSRFTRLTIASIVLPHGLASLVDRAYHRRASDSDVAAEITDPRVYRMRLSLMFGIQLSAEEVADLALFP